MIVIARVQVRVDGDACLYSWSIAPEAHAVGLAPSVGGNRLHMGDDLGTPEGCGVIESALAHAQSAIRHRVLAQWNGLHPLW